MLLLVCQTAGTPCELGLWHASAHVQQRTVILKQLLRPRLCSVCLYANKEIGNIFLS